MKPTSLPAEIIKKIAVIESMMGRERNQDRYSSRIIDIDILLYDDLVITEKGLKIPHRLMHERKFVLVPLCELAPDLIHPILKKSMSVLLEECRDRSKIYPPTPPRGAFSNSQFWGSLCHPEELATKDSVYLRVSSVSLRG